MTPGTLKPPSPSGYRGEHDMSNGSRILSSDGGDLHPQFLGYSLHVCGYHAQESAI
jgi:hypothetical protein